MSKDFTVKDWLAEMERVMKPTAENEGFRTAKELCESLQVSKVLVVERLQKLAKEDILEVKRIRRQRIDGLWTTVPAYRIKAGK